MTALQAFGCTILALLLTLGLCGMFTRRLPALIAALRAYRKARHDPGAEEAEQDWSDFSPPDGSRGKIPVHGREM